MIKQIFRLFVIILCPIIFIVTLPIEIEVNRKFAIAQLSQHQLDMWMIQYSPYIFFGLRCILSFICIATLIEFIKSLRRKNASE